MTWFVASRNALRDWKEPDEGTRRALTIWLKRLAVDGPPLLFEMDETGRFCRTIAPTGNVVEYVVVRSGDGGVIGILVIRN